MPASLRPLPQPEVAILSVLPGASARRGEPGGTKGLQLSGKTSSCPRGLRSLPDSSATPQQC